MNYKKKIYWTLVTSLFLAILSLILGSPDNFGLCSKNDIVCLHGYIDQYNSFIVPVFIFSIPTFFIAFLSLFLIEQVFNAWFKFAIIFVPVSIMLIAILPSMGDMFFPSIKEVAIFSLPVIYLIVSLGLIILQAKKLKK